MLFQRASVRFAHVDVGAPAHWAGRRPGTLTPSATSGSQRQLTLLQAGRAGRQAGQASSNRYSQASDNRWSQACDNRWSHMQVTINDNYRWGKLIVTIVCNNKK